ncbi:hypothetical protein DPMN_160187 [Dreissena polymorpha]|uniref:Uncharacterized protein n=1 Tax=Dreissena polymorpha TaxID=45954 RepID=A0A9D4EKC0_DREPO|nr:hypothetical protein DPMN_160187 [Dreissena polymorpha]
MFNNFRIHPFYSIVNCLTFELEAALDDEFVQFKAILEADQDKTINRMSAAEVRWR